MWSLKECSVVCWCVGWENWADDSRHCSDVHPLDPSWNIHDDIYIENTKALTFHAKSLGNTQKYLLYLLGKLKRYNVVVILYHTLLSASFSKSTWDGWNWPPEIKCSGERRRKPKSACFSALSLGSWVMTGHVDQHIKSAPGYGHLLLFLWPNEKLLKHSQILFFFKTWADVFLSIEKTLTLSSLGLCIWFPKNMDEILFLNIYKDN